MDGEPDWLRGLFTWSSARLPVRWLRVPDGAPWRRRTSVRSLLRRPEFTEIRLHISTARRNRRVMLLDSESSRDPAEGCDSASVPALPANVSSDHRPRKQQMPQQLSIQESKVRLASSYAHPHYGPLVLFRPNHRIRDFSGRRILCAYGPRRDENHPPQTHSTLWRLCFFNFPWGRPYFYGFDWQGSAWRACKTGAWRMPCWWRPMLWWWTRWAVLIDCYI